MNEKLDELSFMLYAAKHYTNPGSLDTDEFFSDLKRFKYIKRLLNKYHESGELKERLILNHIIVLFNIFGDSATDMLFFRLKEYENELATFLVYLNRLSEEKLSTFVIDNEIANALRKI